MNIPVTNIYAKSTARIIAAAKNIYDIKFVNDGEATIGGVFFLIVPVIFSLLCYYNYSLINDSKTFFTIFVLGALTIRVIVVTWTGRLAKELNRKSLNWMIMSAFIPGITLMIMGSLKKFKDIIDFKKLLWVPKIKMILSPVLMKRKVGLV